ncbi:hypothetical protein CO731_00820 [Aminobacter sp. MSH1]|uniref:hypothetical protein n=1 Tax=Aminobacter sp. MSH1 TaxID=374606 RepID=UPI000D3B5BBC|nr:hypothetical protein [Aminobacter sp. MSH1]AWC21369.1 hypothetical protein CO731_00820 [Aminobacter sp. MSH1]
MPQQQNFIGGLIAGKVLETVIGRVLDKVAVNPKISLDPVDVPAVREVVAESVRNELAAREQHSTNNEPAYQSRVAQGSVASILGALALISELWTNGVPDAPTLYVGPATILVGAAWALYGRFIAKKPLGA